MHSKRKIYINELENDKTFKTAMSARIVGHLKQGCMLMLRPTPEEAYTRRSALFSVLFFCSLFFSYCQLTQNLKLLFCSLFLCSLFFSYCQLTAKTYFFSARCFFALCFSARFFSAKIKLI